MSAYLQCSVEGIPRKKINLHQIIIFLPLAGHTEQAVRRVIYSYGVCLQAGVESREHFM